MGKRKRESASAALPLPSFLPFYFCVRAFSISLTWLSRSLEQATRKCFSANLNSFTASNRYVKNNGGIDTENGYPHPCNKSCCFDKSKVGATCTGEKMTKWLVQSHLLRIISTVRSRKCTHSLRLVTCSRGVDGGNAWWDPFVSPSSPFALHFAFPPPPAIWTPRKSSRSLPSKEERRQDETRQFFLPLGKDTKNRFGMD